MRGEGADREFGPTKDNRVVVARGCTGRRGRRPLHATVKPPLCKGRWHGVSRDGGIGACMGVLGCIRKVTIPQSA